MHGPPGSPCLAFACNRVGERQHQDEKLREIKSQLEDPEDVARCLFQLSLCSLAQGSGKEAVEFAGEAVAGEPLAAH